MFGSMTEQDDRNGAAVRAQGNAAACGQANRMLHPLNFPKYGGKGGTGRPFFQTPQQVILPGGPHHDQPGRINAKSKQSSPMKPPGFLGCPDILNNQDWSWP